MATAEDRFLRRMFVGLLLVCAVTVAIGTLVPGEFKMLLNKIHHWIFTTLPVGMIIVWGTLLVFGFIIVTGSVLALHKLYTVTKSL